MEALPLGELEKRIGYTFRNREYLKKAVTHSSFSNETGAHNHHILCNERQEFLGDAVLSVITSDYLYRRFPDLPEGDLSRIRSAIVCEKACAEYSRSIGLGDFLLLGKGEREHGGAQKENILGDAFEAILAAICLDAGGIEHLARVSEFLLPFLTGAVDKLASNGLLLQATDYKTQLQEFAQKNQEDVRYESAGEDGPDHDKTFFVNVYLNSNKIGSGSGHSKKQAEQAAAREALLLFGMIRENPAPTAEE